MQIWVFKGIFSINNHRLASPSSELLNLAMPGAAPPPFSVLLFKYFFFIINGLNSLHMLQLPPYRRVRLTCYHQHVTSILSLLWLCGYDATFFHQTLACSMCGITFLFTGLLLSFQCVNKKHTPLKVKLTPLRVCTNVWTHYGSTACLWYTLVQPPTLQHLCIANLGFLAWAGRYAHRAQEIYDVHPDIDVVQSGIAPILVLFYVGFNVVLYGSILDVWREPRVAMDSVVGSFIKWSACAQTC